MNVNELEHECLEELSDILLDNAIDIAIKIRKNKVFPVIQPIIQKTGLSKDEKFALYEATDLALANTARYAYLMGMRDFINLTKGARINYDFND